MELPEAALLCDMSSAPEKFYNPNVVQKLDFVPRCSTKSRFVRAMCDFNFPPFRMSLFSFDETSTEIDFAGYGIAIHIPGGVQRPTGESDMFKNEVKYVHGLFSSADLCTKRP